MINPSGKHIVTTKANAELLKNDGYMELEKEKKAENISEEKII